MRRHLYLVLALSMACSPAHALQSLRIGDRVVAVGDSAARLKALLGEPSSRGTSAGAGKSRVRKNASRGAGDSREKKAKANGEQWQYQRNGRITTFTIVNGKIAQIQDVAR